MGDLRLERYHALGNVYLVVEEAAWGDLSARLGVEAEALTRRICDPHFGVGADGILVATSGAGFGVRILNPDGGEAEKSGNGLRIFARSRFDRGEVVGGEPFEVDTLGGRVRCVVLDGGATVQVDMGRVTFRSGEIPVAGHDREVLRESIEIDGDAHEFSAAGIGNPHCVLLRDELSVEETVTLGPRIESHEFFPNRVNVQFLRVRDRGNLEIEIWERGAGRTLASGSSSSAAAAVARRLGLCDAVVRVHMPGGALDLQFDSDFAVRMTGPVTHVASCVLADEALAGAS